MVAADGKSHPVAASIQSADTVRLTLPEGVTEPQAVRYAWAPDPDVNLVNSGDLPASPFEMKVEGHR